MDSNPFLDRRMPWRRARHKGELCLQLARLPERNTSPVLLVSSAAAVLCANPACLPVLTAEGLPQTGTAALLPPAPDREIRAAVRKRSRGIVFEHQVGTRLFQGRANPVQLARHASWGCDEAQGYLLGRPQMPLQDSR